MKTRQPKKLVIAAAVLALTVTTITASAQKFKADVPNTITTPDSVETRIGTLKFKDGLPDAETAKKIYDNLDFARGVEAFLAGIPATSVQALKNGFIEAGFPPNGAIGITESLSDARTLYLTPNATVVYEWFCMDVEKGPMVVEVPPAVLGIIDDAYLRPALIWSVSSIDVVPNRGNAHGIRSRASLPPSATAALPEIPWLQVTGAKRSTPGNTWNQGPRPCPQQSLRAECVDGNGHAIRNRERPGERALDLRFHDYDG
jgi:Protein of unknown function (DUF1254)